MEKIFVVAGVISMAYLLFKFIEMRFIEKENKPFKYLLRDTLLVYFSVFAGIFVYEQLTPVVKDTISPTPNPMVFTDNPEF